MKCASTPSGASATAIGSPLRPAAVINDARAHACAPVSLSEGPTYSATALIFAMSAALSASVSHRPSFRVSFEWMSSPLTSTSKAPRVCESFSTFATSPSSCSIASARAVANLR